MEMIVIPVCVGAFGTVSKSLEKSLEELNIRERIDISQSTEPNYLRVLDNRGNLSIRLKKTPKNKQKKN